MHEIHNDKNVWHASEFMTKKKEENQYVTRKLESEWLLTKLK